MKRLARPWLLAFALTMFLPLSAPPAEAQKLECEVFKWEQDGMNEADMEAGTMGLNPTIVYRATVGIRQTACTPREYFCGAPTQRVTLKLENIPAFVDVDLADSSVPITTDDPGNLEAVTRATYKVHPQTLAQTLFTMGLVATCPNGTVIRGNASFHVGGYYAVSASAGPGARHGDEIRWPVHVQNEGNVRLYVVTLVNATSAPDPGWSLPKGFVLNAPSAADPDGGALDLTVAYRGAAVPPGQIVVVRPYVLGDPSSIGADVPLALLDGPAANNADGPGFLLLGLTAASALFLGRRLRRTR